MYKKSYKGFVWWMIAFLAGLAAICFLPVKDESVLMRHHAADELVCGRAGILRLADGANLLVQRHAV